MKISRIIVALFFLLAVSTKYLLAQPTLRPIYEINDDSENNLRKELLDELRKELKNELRQELKEELRQEFKQQMIEEFQPEIRKMIQQEVTTYLADNPSPPLEETANLYFYQLSPQKQEAIREIVRDILAKEIQRVNDQELESIVAGDVIKPDITIAQGIKKEILKDQYKIAYAKPDDEPVDKSNENLTKNDLNVTAGEKRAESIERTLAARGGLLLPKGKFQIEPSTTWAHFSSNRIHIQGFLLLPILIGDISTQTIKRDIFIHNLTFKYGLLNNFQGEVKVPWRYEYDRFTDTSNLTETQKDKGGLGDIELGFSRQIGWERGLLPDLVAAIGVKSKTGKNYNEEVSFGSGHWGIRGSLIAAKSSDPAVVFGSLSYTYNFEEANIPGIGTIKPGDTIGYSLGTAIALSYQTAINFSFDHSVTFKTTRDSRNLNGTFLNVGNFKTGFNWAFNEQASVDFSVSIGVTTDAPDVSVSIRVPYSF